MKNHRKMRNSLVLVGTRLAKAYHLCTLESRRLTTYPTVGVVYSLQLFFLFKKETPGTCMIKRGHVSSGITPHKPPSKKAVLNTSEEQQ